MNNHPEIRLPALLCRWRQFLTPLLGGLLVSCAGTSGGGGSSGPAYPFPEAGSLRNLPQASGVLGQSTISALHENWAKFPDGTTLVYEGRIRKKRDFRFGGVTSNEDIERRIAERETLGFREAPLRVTMTLKKQGNGQITVLGSASVNGRVAGVSLDGWLDCGGSDAVIDFDNYVPSGTHTIETRARVPNGAKDYADDPLEWYPLILGKRTGYTDAHSKSFSGTTLEVFEDTFVGCKSGVKTFRVAGQSFACGLLLEELNVTSSADGYGLASAIASSSNVPDRAGAFHSIFGSRMSITLPSERTAIHFAEEVPGLVVRYQHQSFEHSRSGNEVAFEGFRKLARKFNKPGVPPIKTEARIRLSEEIYLQLVDIRKP